MGDGMRFLKVLFPENPRPYILVGILVVAVLLIFYSFDKVNENTTSMEPALHRGDLMLGARSVMNPRRFDIVYLVESNNPGDTLVKRIIGLPGETIQMRKGHVYIRRNDESPEIQLVEQYLSDERRGDESWPPKPLRIPDNCYYVLGDNRVGSRDSRTFGCVDKNYIKGRVRLVYWPFKHRKIFWRAE